MKSLFSFRILAFSALCALGCSSCEQRTHTETTAETTGTDTVTVSRTQTTIRPNEDVQEFKHWVNERTNRADSNSKEKWPEIKADFKNRTARLEAQMDTFSAESRQEFEAAKARYKAWENRRDARTSRPLDPAKLATWRNTILGKYKDLKTVNAANAREAYLTFIGAVRANKNEWTQDEWDYVDNIYSELNQRKREIDTDISITDGLKIKTLQAEYLTFETAADAQDAKK